ncbi:hypothetical protein Psed_5787 [Pseudonocardia dioxanivorans CB1190]|uniref:DUF935 family protein n=1 Tax=Pseudonocardia dioxanivorans (strain ATCC 55486 / DSM 44775 / JCM 13855 / CB1190) TaxID=675635 RepID=F4D1C6_PSEUX|nr:hypothetical protein [Pseudonocardia dioxanivorans]AEA27914.1 hypothetical protein Psed_5787 [Pseudonocardia dioxanivorans CB1190]
MVATPLSAAPTSEIGYATEASNWWTAAAEETTPELQWPKSIRVYDQMRRQDTQVKSILRAVTLPVRRTAWRIEPGDARPEVVALVAEDLRLPVVGQPAAAPGRSRDRFSWRQHLELALLSLPFGHMFFEQVYRLDESGRARLRKLAPRMPRSISAINVAADGGLISIEQYPATITARQQRPIPVSRLVGYVFEQEGGNWYGNSILRAAYKNWLLKDRLLRVQAQTVERNGMGVPLYEAAEDETDLARGRKLAQEWRSGEAAGAAVPHGAKLTLRGVEGSLPDADKPIRYHDEQIARTALAHFLNLGTQTGSWALGTTLGEFFTLSLQTLAENIADVANQHIVEDLVDLNYGPDEAVPRVVFDEIGSQHAITAQAMKLLIDAGAVSADPELEQHLRQVYGLPPRSGAAPADPAPTEDQ